MSLMNMWIISYISCDVWLILSLTEWENGSDLMTLCLKTRHKDLRIIYFASKVVSRTKCWAQRSRYLVETYLIKHMFVSTCLEKVITQNCPTITCFIPGLCQLSRTGWHLSEACQPPGGTEETTGSREAVEQCFVKEILKHCLIEL